MNQRLTEQPQPTSPRSDTAQIWVELLAEIIVAAVQKEEQRHVGNSPVANN